MKVRSLLGVACAGIVMGCLVSSAQAVILNTRTGSTYTIVQTAVNMAAPGDTLEFDGTIFGGNAFAKVNKNLTLRGVGATRAVLDANWTCPGNLGILSIENMASVTIENMAFLNCRGASGGNGCGIRMSNPQDLIIRNCYFYNNEDGIMGANSALANITVEYSEFNYNGWGDLGQTHNIYVGNCNSFTMKYSWSHNAHVGHEVKTRSKRNYILYNRIGNESPNPDHRNASYEINLPNGGTSYIIGNQIHQGDYTENSSIISYAEEGASNPDQHLYVINNTIVNTRGAGTFVRNTSTTTALVQNNIFQGTGTTVSGPATILNNWVTNNALLQNTSMYDYHLTASSYGAINLGAVPSPNTGVNGFSLIPVSQYVHPLNYVARPSSGTIDIGAYEYAAPNTAPTVNTGPDLPVVYENNTVNLHAAGNDNDGDPLNYAWSQLAGPTVTLAGASTPDASFTVPVLTSQSTVTMTFRVDVADGRGGTADATVNVQVYMAGDADHNGTVNVGDLQILVGAWGSSTGSGTWNASADFDGNGVINVADLQVLIGQWGRSL